MLESGEVPVSPLASPAGLKSIPCEIEGCDEMFSDRSHMKRHVRGTKHGNKEKQFACTECPSAYATKDALGSHKRRKHKRPRVDSAESSDTGFSMPSSPSVSAMTPTSSSASPMTMCAQGSVDSNIEDEFTSDFTPLNWGSSEMTSTNEKATQVDESMLPLGNPPSRNVSF